MAPKTTKSTLAITPEKTEGLPLVAGNDDIKPLKIEKKKISFATYMLMQSNVFAGMVGLYKDEQQARGQAKRVTDLILKNNDAEVDQ